MSTLSIEQLLAATQNTTETSTSNSKPEYDVAYYINVVLFGVLKASIRIYKDPAKQKGMSKEQAQLHKMLAEAPVDKIEALLNAKGIEVESVKSAEGSVDEDKLAKFAAFLKS